jgi:hypothetical protein
VDWACAESWRVCFYLLPVLVSYTKNIVCMCRVLLVGTGNEKNQYSLRPILLFVNTDVSITKMCLGTSILAKSIMGRREYVDISSM